MLENGDAGGELGEACVSFSNFAARRGDTLFAVSRRLPFNSHPEILGCFPLKTNIEMAFQ
jgi:hypothetical protein